MRLLTISIIVVLLGTAACKKHDCNHLDADYFIFGRAYGMCGGPNCAQFYKIENGRVFADDMDYYTYENVFTFSNAPLSQAKYSIAFQALSTLPAYMTSNPGQTWGCPDCHDQGGLHFAWSENGITHYWHVDTDMNEQPPAIRPYMAQVNDILNQLAN